MTDDVNCCQSLLDWGGCEVVPGNSSSHWKPYPKPTQVDMVENTKALERTMLKELGKMHPVSSREGMTSIRRQLLWRWHRPGGGDCLLKTQGSAKSQDDV